MYKDVIVDLINNQIVIYLEGHYCFAELVG